MTFEEAAAQILGVSFQIIQVYLDEEDSVWKAVIASPAVTHSLSASTRGDAQDEAAAWILSSSRRVISDWVYSGGDFGGSRAIYA